MVRALNSLVPGLLQREFYTRKAVTLDDVSNSDCWSLRVALADFKMQFGVLSLSVK